MKRGSTAAKEACMKQIARTHDTLSEPSSSRIKPGDAIAPYIVLWSRFANHATPSIQAPFADKNSWSLHNGGASTSMCNSTEVTKSGIWMQKGKGKPPAWNHVLMIPVLRKVADKKVSGLWGLCRDLSAQPGRTAAVVMAE